MAIFIHNQVFQLRKNHKWKTHKWKNHKWKTHKWKTHKWKIHKWKIHKWKTHKWKTCYIINTYSIKYLIKELSKEEVSSGLSPAKEDLKQEDLSQQISAIFGLKTNISLKQINHSLDQVMPARCA